MGDYSIKDYAGARDSADKIKEIAEKILDIFHVMDDAMNNLAEAWRSRGAEEVLSIYHEISAQYPSFYQRICDNNKFIHSVVDIDQEADESNKKRFEAA